MGTRLQSVQSDRPKGFVTIDGEPIITRSVRRLRAAGIREFVFVIGWRGEVYRNWGASECPDARWVENAEFAMTGSLSSLLRGAAAAPGRDVIVAESDLLYESRAVTALQMAPAADTVLASGLTGSRDEVWIYDDGHGKLGELTKTARAGVVPFGELVGLSRLSGALLTQLARAAETLPATAHYEDGLNAVASRRPISLLKIDDLAWCEIDDAAHLARAERLIWPRIAAAEERAGATT